MALLTDTAVMQTVQTDLGLAYANLLTTIDTATSTSCIAELITVRTIIDADITDNDYPNADAWATAMHTLIASLPTTQRAILSPIAQAIDAYFIAQTGSKTRIYFKTGVTWSDNFRILWTLALQEEIIVRLGSSTNSSGTWSYTADKITHSDAALELHTPSTIGASPIVVTLTLTHFNPALANTIVVVNIPALTSAGTIFPISSPNKFLGISTMVVTSGSNGDSVECWVS